MKILAAFLFNLLALTLTFSGLVAENIEVIRERRIQDIIQESHSPGLANKWRDEITTQGNWSDVDYTVGCPASRPDWKAPEHVRRIITMASLWSHNNSDVDLLQKINLALDHWLSNDFTDEGCITGGSIERYCPCGTPGFWNPNWWYQMILMPRLVGNACLLLQPVLTQSQLSVCIYQTTRAYNRIDGDPDGPMGKMTGANLLDVTWTGVTIAILTSDQTIMQDAYSRSYNESELTYEGEDGIKVDGSFMQHSGQLLTGSYGSVFITNMIKIFLETRETSLEAPESVQSAFLTLISGCEWFIYHKNGTGNEEDPFPPLLMWEYSVIGRSISHKYSDWRGIGFNLNQLLNATGSWGNYPSFQAIVERLQSKGSVNPGGLVGTRYFHVTDYLVHRGLNYIVTLKMYSKRTTNSECYNAQNPFGFHLSDGAIWTYLDGNEYTDVAGGWDWYLIPGSTVPYAQTSLVCHQVEYKGKETFVGGLGFGNAGIAVMNYTNPAIESVIWTKTFFFFSNLYIVQFVGPVISGSTNDIFTTLDQRHLSGPVVIDGDVIPEGEVKVRRLAQRFWHDRIGYKFMNPVNLTVDTTHRQSNWEEIGTSVGNETLKLMAAYFEHPADQQIENYFTYIAYLDISLEDFERITDTNETNLKIAEIDHSVPTPEVVPIVRGASYGTVGSGNRIISLVFLTPGEYFTGLEDVTLVATDSPILIQFQRKETNIGWQWQLGLSDPTQTLSRAIVQVTLGGGQVSATIVADLPSGAWAGSMVLYDI